MLLRASLRLWWGEIWGKLWPAAAACFGVAMFVFCFWAYPKWVAKSGAAKDKSVAATEHDVRKDSMTLFVVAAGGGSLLLAGRQYSLARRAQISDRFRQAVELLCRTGTGDEPALTSRTGALMALELIALEAREERERVREFIAGYVRNETRRRCAGGGRRAGLAPQAEGSFEEVYRPEEDKWAKNPLVRWDIQTALGILGRLPREPWVRTDLEEAYLAGHDFTGLDLRGFDLRRANLCGCTLQPAIWGDCRVEGAWGYRAVVTETDARFLTEGLARPDPLAGFDGQ